MNETTELIMKQLNSKKVHAETHEVGGGDEIDVLKLKNVDALERIDHSVKHEIGGSDEIDVTKLRNIDQYVTVDGNFTGTWNGIEMTSTEPGLSSAFNALKADISSRSVNAKYPPTGFTAVKGDNLTDDTAIIQTLLNNFEYVYIPDGDYVISDTIIIGEGKKLTFSKNANIHFTSPTKNVIQLKTRSEFSGGKIYTPNLFSGGVIYLTDIVNYATASDFFAEGLTSTEIATGYGIWMDGAGKEGSACYGLYNHFENIEIRWLNTGVKMASNESAVDPSYFNSNIFNNIKMWHVNQIVDISRYNGANIFNNITTQCGIEDTLLYKVNGELNIFKNIVYYDLPLGCVIVNFGNNSMRNSFELWFENSPGFSANYSDTGNRNVITVLGGYTQDPKNITLEAPWAAPGGNYQIPSYYKNNNSKEVRLRGKITGGAVNQRVTIIPQDARIQKHTMFICATDDGFARVEALWTGEIIPRSFSGASTNIHLDGIQYRMA